MSTQAKKVFIVDDEPLLTEMLHDDIKNHFPAIEVETFPTGEACIKRLNQQPDLVILDYYLNSKEQEASNGIDILKEIKNINKSLPVIMLSSQTSYGTAAQTIAYGAIHYVIKGESAFGEIRKLIKTNL